ncbi:hypothetical protein [Enterococcus faecalis]|uniref:hypothetical protein n=1 Tax=Enterococcus faecalis TaxID=1351 RepID=UPI0030C80ABA
MNISNWIELLGIVASFSLSAVAIWQSRKSIKLTEQSIIDSNKPYVVCYLAMTDVGFFEKYFVIKNFGNTPAKIIEIQSSAKISSVGSNLYLQSLTNTIIAPSQKFVTAFNSEYKKNELIEVKIVFEDYSGNRYNETFLLNPDFSADIAYHRNNSTKYGDEHNDLRNILHSFAKNNL